jgi:hypothetical protein
MIVGLQWEFARGFMFEPEYITTFGRELTGYWDINNFNGRTVPGQGSRRINNNIGADNYRSNAFMSNYHSLQMLVRKTYSRGLSFNASYSYAKTLDNLSDLFNYRVAMADTMNVHYDYGPSDFDMRHRFLTVVSYDLPLFKGNRFAGGWTINTILSLQGGVPFNVYDSSSANDRNRDGRYFDRIVPVGGVAPMSTVTSTSPADGYFDTTKWARYTCPATVNQGLWCNVPIGRNSMYGPSYQNVDFSFSKKFGITEKVSLKLQGSAFNALNRSNFGLPTGNRNTGVLFGKSVSTFDPRVIQLALRLDF